MNTEEYIQTLKDHVSANEQNVGNGEYVLTLLYEAYAEITKSQAFIEGLKLGIRLYNELNT